MTQTSTLSGYLDLRESRTLRESRQLQRFPRTGRQDTAASRGLSSQECSRRELRGFRGLRDGGGSGRCGRTREQDRDVRADAWDRMRLQHQTEEVRE